MWTREASAGPGILVNGEWQEASRTTEVIDPATGDVVGHVACAEASQTCDAADAAVAAMADWSTAPAVERGRVLRSAAACLRARSDDIATLLTAESGKLLSESAAEVGLAAAFLEWYAEESRRAYGQLVQTPTGKRAEVRSEPAGPALLISPWNFPVSIVARKVAPALAAGCTTVVKPSEVAPLAALQLIECLQDAGCPAGVVNVVTGSVAETSDLLLDDGRFRVVSFTGSTRVGRIVAERAAGTLARPTLELGGDAPFLVFDDADLEVALEQLMLAKYRNAGQSCVAANRLLVQESVYDEFVSKFVSASTALQVGAPTEAGTQLGPVISGSAKDRLTTWTEEAREAGATVLEGSVPQGPGTYVPPTIVLEPPSTVRLSGEEVFGPAIGVWPFSDEEEAVRLGNNTEMGLAAYVATRDLGRARRISERLEAGIVGVNDGLPPTPELPFGGFGRSGYGKEGGHQGMAEFLREKYVSTNL